MRKMNVCPMCAYQGKMDGDGVGRVRSEFFCAVQVQGVG